MKSGSPIPEALIDEIANEISGRYRIVPDAAKRVLIKHLNADKKLCNRIGQVARPEDIPRLHEWKKAIKEVKKGIYYNLRRYHRDKQAEHDLVSELERRISAVRPADEIAHILDELMLMHSSTAERHSYYSAFYKELFRIVPSPASIIDVACGLHPLSYPFDNHEVKRYVAIDRDELCINALSAFSKSGGHVRLHVITSEISEIEWNSVLDKNEEFDLALMLKLIPVLSRQDKSLLDKLAEVPSKRILVTANAEALVRRQDVSRREERELKSFIKTCGRKITGNFRIPNEFGYVIE